ncbi:MAG: glycosyltransferase family 2 protein [Solirubrobacteraceae bacterium MAG38_C4-C5]|nr:glycosyltransferase family 2 protein [Candidatus Siliceabacter maunaloa]
MTTGQEPDAPPGNGITAVILSFNRSSILSRTLDEVERLPFDEILVVDAASTDGSAEMARGRGGRVQVMALDHDPGIASLNIAIRATRTEHVVILDDDSYPTPGAVERLRAVFDRLPRVGVVGGYIRDTLPDGREHRGMTHTFDWYLGGGRISDDPHGVPTFFFPQGGCMIRRSAFLEAGGFFEPQRFVVVELDVSTRMIAAGWDVRYLRDAVFIHLRPAVARPQNPNVLRIKVRNDIWYFWLRFPLSMAVRRVPAYAVHNLVQCAYRGATEAWSQGVADAWRDREEIRGMRQPLSREVLRRAEMNRGRLHAALMLKVLRTWLGRKVRAGVG